MERADLFADLLLPGERMCGEWLAKVHGNRYWVEDETVFAPFDIMVGMNRIPYQRLLHRVDSTILRPPYLCHEGRGVSVESAFKMICAVQKVLPKRHCIDKPEGLVYRVEHKGNFEFMAKWVRPDKVDGELMNSDEYNYKRVWA